MHINTILLDAGGVLTFPNWDRVSDTLARHGIHVPAEALRAAEPRAKFAIDTASHVAATNDADRGSRYFRLVFSGAGIAPDAPIDAALNDLWEYHGEHNLWEYVPEEVPAALQQLQSLGIPLAVASNANGALHRLFDRLGLSRYFVAICDSCVEGVEKPDPAFFRIVLERAGGVPETTIHVGDLYHVDIVGARSAGLRAILLDPFDLYAQYEAERVKKLTALVELVARER